MIFWDFIAHQMFSVSADITSDCSQLPLTVSRGVVKLKQSTSFAVFASVRCLFMAISDLYVWVELFFCLIKWYKKKTI